MKTRRQFFRQLAFGTEPAVPDAGAAPFVCIFLRGGADTLNMFVPYADDNYYKMRPSIGVPPPSANKGTKDAALKLDDFYALHPRLAPLLTPFADGRLAIIQAVGSDNDSGSHFSAQDQMEHGECSGHSLNGGWLGRYLSSRSDPRTTPLTAVAVSATLPESLRGAPAMTALTSLDDVQMQMPAQEASLLSSALETMYAAEAGVVGKSGRDTLSLLKRVADLRQKTLSDSRYPDNEFSQGLRQIARLIKAGVGLEVAAIDSNGWDTHFIQGAASGLQADRMQELAEGLAVFERDVRGHNATIVVMTEFGRRIYENASLGTDHGRGFALMALGDTVKGGKVFGEWPGLADDGEFKLGPSGLSIKHDYRAVLAEALGLRGTQLQRIFPELEWQPLGFVSFSN